MITVLGASGFIGSHLANKLAQFEVEFQTIGRSEPLPAGNLGHVVYCIGLTADFRSRLFDTVEAHVCTLLELVRKCRFDSLLYLSSTRLYAAGDSTDEEQSLCVAPRDQSDLYNISKVMGESIALNSGRPARVVRIANVYGPDFASDNFLPSLLKRAVSGERIVLQTAPDSAKDYISITDVVDGLIRIVNRGQDQIYNLASGINVSHAQLAERLRSLTGCTFEFTPGAPAISRPQININRMRAEFSFAPASVLDDLPKLVQLYEGNRSRT